ncbi:MAG: nitrate- and nitrite sensing domain-containing protein [Microthrixaceae bacterium]
MLLPAALTLSALAGLGVEQRLGERATAVRNRDVTALAEATGDLIHELQAERLAAVVAARRPDNLTEHLLSTQRRETDRAADSVRRALGARSLGELRSNGGARGDAVESVAATVDDIAPLRSRVRNVGAAEMQEEYTAAIETPLVDIGRLELGTASQTSGITRHWLAQSIEGESAAASDATALLDGSGAGTDEREASAAAAVESLTRSRLAVDAFTAAASPHLAQRYRDARKSLAVLDTDTWIDRLSDATGSTVLDVDAVQWPSSIGKRLDAIAAVERGSFVQDLDSLTHLAAGANDEAIVFGCVIAAICLILFLVALLVSRQITTNLAELATSAQELSEVHVPALMAGLRSGDASSAQVAFTEIPVDTRDEFAEVAHTLNGLGAAMVDLVRSQHEILQRGISELFINLARRNQSLLDRQIELIDELEADEEDPDRLEQLFRLDHVATRMRRNAESLLVLASTDSPRSRGRDTQIEDVVRVAVGEVEDYPRIHLKTMEAASVTGAAAVDLAHVLAELMENAVQYSPPGSPVEVVGHTTLDGEYVITINDQGVGLSPTRLLEANIRLAEPPPVGLAMSRSLGFVVAGTLSRRHGIGVRLRDQRPGLVAEVRIPPRCCPPLPSRRPRSSNGGNAPP